MFSATSPILGFFAAIALGVAAYALRIAGPHKPWTVAITMLVAAHALFVYLATGRLFPF